MLASSSLTVQIVTIATLNIFKKRFIGIECKFTRKFRKSSSFTFLTARSEELTPSTLSHFHFVKRRISRKPKTGQNLEYSMVAQNWTRILIHTEMIKTSLVDSTVLLQRLVIRAKFVTWDKYAHILQIWTNSGTAKFLDRTVLTLASSKTFADVILHIFQMQPERTRLLKVNINPLMTTLAWTMWAAYISLEIIIALEILTMKKKRTRASTTTRSHHLKQRYWSGSNLTLAFRTTCKRSVGRGKEKATLTLKN